MAEQILPNPGDANFAPNIIEAKALESVEEQFEAKKKIFDAEKEALLLRASAKDDKSAIERIEERFQRVEKYHDIRLDLAKKIEEREESIAKITDEGERNVALLALERQKKEIEFEKIKTQAAERYESTQTKLGNIWDDLTSPVKFLKRKAKEAAILTVAHFLRMKREKQVETQRIEGMEKSLDGVGGFMEQGGTESPENTALAVVDDVESVLPEETKNYYAEMLGFMGRLTTSTEESTSEQIAQNKRDSRVSASEEAAAGALGGPTDTPLLGGPDVKKKKKKKGIMGKMADMNPMKSISGLFGSLFKGLGSIGKMILGLGSKLLIPLVTTPVGWAVILGGIAIGFLWTFKDKIAEVIGSVWEGIKSGVDKVIGFIKGIFSKVWDIVKSILSVVPGGSYMISALENLGGGGNEEEDAKNKEIANERMGGDQAVRQKSQKDVYREMDEKNSNPHYDEPWGKFYKAPTGAKAGKPRYERTAINKAKMDFRAAKLEGSEQTSGGLMGGNAQRGRQAQNGAMENYALSSVAHKGTGAQAQGNTNMLNAPTTNVMNQTIEDRSFNNDPTIQQLNPHGVRADF
jgi:hypothetical protein